MKKLLFLIIILLTSTITVSGAYYESDSFFTLDGTEYFYAAELSYTTYYIGETIDLDTEIVVDFFGIDSYSFYDIEMWVLAEDFDGFVYFEDSHFTTLDIAFDGESIVVEWDILVTADFPDRLYLYVAADFYEETSFGDEFYSDSYEEITSIRISDGERAGNSSLITFTLFSTAIIPIIVLKKRKQ